MVRVTLQDGDLFSDSYANSAGFPILDGADAYGHGPKIIDDWLDDAADQLKARFYKWFNRVKVQVSTGLSVNYSGATVLLSAGTTVEIAAGTLLLPDNSSVFIFITDTGAVSFANTLPPVGVAIAKATTSGGTVSTLQDIRHQVLEQSKRFSNVESSGFIEIGDFKMSLSSVPSPGFVAVDNTVRYTQADYPIAYDRIGTVWNLPGDPVNTFRTPPRAVMYMSPGAGRAVGAIGGTATETLTVAQIPTHAHGTNDPGHIHGIIDSGHSHGITGGEHSHSVLGSGLPQSSDLATLSANGKIALVGELVPYFGSVFYGARNSVGNDFISTSNTNVTVAAAGTGVRTDSRHVGVSILPTGSGLPQNNLPPFAVVNFYVRLA